MSDRERFRIHVLGRFRLTKGDTPIAIPPRLRKPQELAIGPVFAGRFGKTLGAPTVDAASHFRHAGLFWIGVLIAALVVGSMLRETGRGHPDQAA